MDATTTASTIAGPVGDLAARFYFSKQAIARGEAIGLDVISLYGAGRAAMLGGVDPETADAIFYFFKPGVIAAVVSRGRSLASEDAIAAAHLGAADDYAEELSPQWIRPPSARSPTRWALSSHGPSGSWPFFDGYRSARQLRRPPPGPTGAAILL